MAGEDFFDVSGDGIHQSRLGVIIEVMAGCNHPDPLFSCQDFQSTSPEYTADCAGIPVRSGNQLIQGRAKKLGESDDMMFHFKSLTDLICRPDGILPVSFNPLINGQGDKPAGDVMFDPAKSFEQGSTVFTS